MWSRPVVVLTRLVVQIPIQLRERFVNECLSAKYTLPAPLEQPTGKRPLAST